VFGLRFAPLLFVAAFLADLIVRSLATNILITLLSELILAGGYTGLAALLRYLAFSPQAMRVRDVIVFVVCGTGAALIVSILYVGLFAATGYIDQESAIGAFYRYWVGDAVGII